MAPVAAGVMHQPAQREVHPGCIEQRKWIGIGVLPVVQAVGDIIGGGRKVRAGEDPRQLGRRHTGPRQLVALLDHIGIGNVALAHPHFHAHVEVLNQWFELVEQIAAKGRRMRDGHAVNARRLHLGISARRGRHLSMAFVGQSQLRITKQAAFGFIRLATRSQVTLERLIQRGSGALVHPGKVIDGFFRRGNGDEGGGGSIHENVLNRELQAILPRFDGEGMSGMRNPVTHI